MTGSSSYHMEKEGYSSLNVKLSADSNFSLRRSISSIATRRNGILSADNYDLISQSYTEGTQSAFLVGILAVFGVLLFPYGSCLRSQTFYGKEPY